MEDIVERAKKELENNIVGKIIKNDNKVEYTNPAGKVLKWSEQSVKDIENAIESALKQDSNTGKYIEGKIANHIKEKGISIKGFGVKINRKTTGEAGDIDILTEYEMIEVKKSYSSWSSKKHQLNKFVDSSMEDFFNPYNKKVILYIDELLSPLQKESVLKTIPKNVVLINSIEELNKILK